MSPTNDNSNNTVSVHNTNPFLIENWKATLKHAWSIKFDLLGLVLGALEFGFDAFTAEPPINRGVFAILGMLVTAASMGVRLIRQDKVSGAAGE